MGISLLYMYPRLVRQTIRNLDRYLQLIDPPPSWTIETILQQPSKTSVINEAEYSQPLCTAIQITLVDLLRHWGVTPLATVGHSSGKSIETLLTQSIPPSIVTLEKMKLMSRNP